MHMLSIGKVLLMRVKAYRLQRAKLIALDISRKKTPYISFIDRLHYWNAKYLNCGCIKAHFRVNHDKQYIQNLFKIYITLTTTGTFPNFILIAILGFLGGVLLSYAYFFMCVVVLDMSTWTAFYVSAFLCIFLTVGMAFFAVVRCVVLSVLPEICTSRARAMLISFALLALLSGPGSNILFNTKQLTNTISCTQEQVGAIGHNLTELYKKPLQILKHGIMYLIKSIKPVIEKLKSFLIWIKNAIIKIGKLMKKVFSWLKVFAINCHTSLGTPAEFCTKHVEVLVKDCEASLGFLGGICNPFEIITLLCLPMKAITAVCNFKDFIKEHVFDFLKAKLKELGHFIKTIFYVKVSFHHSFNFKTNQSKSLKDIYKEVHESQEKRLEFFLGVIKFMKLMLAMYIAYVLLTAFIYRYRFFYQVRYDNRHLNRFLIELDTRRATVNRQTLFPLTPAERSYYVSLLSLRLTSWERRSFLQGSVYLIMVCLKTAFIFLIDLFLYFILDLVHNHGKLSFYFGRDKSIIGADGSGFFYTLYNLFNGLFNVFDIELRFDTGPCLPQPIPFNWLLYERIAVTLGFAWVMSLLQPFALRFRNYVMSYYYPDIARKRAVWLYNQILQTRGVLSQYVRRTLFTRGAIGLVSEKPDPYKWIIARFPRLYFLLPFRYLYKECMVCGYKNPTVRCATPQCTGMYDVECFETLNNTCMICNMRQNFKGLDVSEEEDSDGEPDNVTESRTEQPKWWKFWIQVSRTDSTISMEEGTVGIPDRAVSSASSSSALQPSKDYFSDQWRRDDWASLDDYEIPYPDMGSWTRPHFTTKTPLSSKI